MKTIFFAISLLVVAISAIAQNCPQEGENAPLALHKSWILQGWERKAGDPPFIFAQKMKRYYDLQSPTGVYYDNFAPGPQQLFGNAAIYGANWEALQNGARSVEHALTSGNDQIVDRSVASTTLGFVGKITRLNDQVLAFSGRSQLGWACRDGAWKIRQELNYAWIVKPEDIAQFYTAEMPVPGSTFRM
jgi:hypothetical protein